MLEEGVEEESVIVPMVLLVVKRMMMHIRFAYVAFLVKTLLQWLVIMGQLELLNLREIPEGIAKAFELCQKEIF